MIKKWLTSGLLIVFLLVTGVIAPEGFAGSFHFNSVTFGIGSMLFSGDLAGLGNEDVDVTLVAYGEITALCQNNGGKIAPGRNPISFDVQQTAHFFTDENGKALVDLTAEDPALGDLEPSPTPKDAGCPSANWTVVGVSDETNWTAAQVQVRDSEGFLQLDLYFTCTTTFENGTAVDLTCVEA